MARMVAPATEALPPGVRTLFWEGLAEEPSIDRHGDYVAIRVLERGDEPAVRWLLDRIDSQHLLTIVRSGRLRPAHERFWRAVLEDA